MSTNYALNQIVGVLIIIAILMVMASMMQAVASAASQELVVQR